MYNFTHWFHRCGNGNAVPIGGCNSEDSLRIVSDMCNLRETCTVSATNDYFGDPCPTVYKYLNIVYSCENRGAFITQANVQCQIYL